MQTTMTELARNAGRQVRRVALTREAVVVTEHGRPVAEIRPVPAAEGGPERTPLDWLVALGPCPPAARDRRPYTVPET